MQQKSNKLSLKTMIYLRSLLMQRLVLATQLWFIRE
jgi:hypothetical protein